MGMSKEKLKDGRYFKVREFRCKHCGSTGDLKQSIIDLCDAVREELGAPVVVNSGYRCPVHNRRVGGAALSRHVVGDAADLRPVDPALLPELKRIALRLNPEGGVGMYRGFVHIDTRGRKARW